MLHNNITTYIYTYIRVLNAGTAVQVKIYSVYFI